MFYRIVTGTTTEKDAFIAGFLMFVCFFLGVAVGVIYG